MIIWRYIKLFWIFIVSALPGHHAPLAASAPVDPNYIDPRDFNRNSQIAHFFTMAFLNTVWSYFWLITGHPVVAVSGVVPSMAYGVIHEFWYDPRFENKATRGSDLEDFGFLMVGMLTGQTVGLAMAIVAVMELL
jgi:hypothetical protein